MFFGGLHGWWDGVQPGLGSERSLNDCLTLKDLHPVSLAVIRRRAREIAGVLVNPVQAFHPNTPPPSDAILLTSDVRKTQDSTSQYAQWLRPVARGVPAPLAFRCSSTKCIPAFASPLAERRNTLACPADMVVYGKTVAGGMPIGVVCGKKDLMRRFDVDAPYARCICDWDVFCTPDGDGGHARILALGRCSPPGWEL